MSNLKKAVKNVTILSAIAAVIMAAALIVGIVFGVNGWGVFNKDALLKDSKTLTVSVNTFTYQTELDDVESACENVLSSYGIAYKMEGQMSGDVCEVVYVFDKDVDLSAAVQSLETTFAGSDWQDTNVSFAVNTEAAFGILAEGYVWRGVVAGVVMAVLVFVYVALRYGIFKGIAVGATNLFASALTVSVVLLTRLPVTASVIYVFGLASLFSSVAAIVALNKIGDAEEGACVMATKEIGCMTAIVAVAFVLVGAIAVPGVRWFAVLGLVALLVSAVVTWAYVPTFYLPFKVIEDNKPVEGAYVGAEKTSTKEKKVFTKKAVEVAPVEEAPVEEAPVEEAPVEEAPVEEAPVEETPVEEVPMEEAEVVVEENQD